MNVFIENLWLVVDIALFAFLFWLICCLCIKVFYRYILYPSPQGKDFVVPPKAQLLYLKGHDGNFIKFLFFPPNEKMPTFVYFHGNGETLQSNIAWAQKLHNKGFGLGIMEYRGYGKAEGKPFETDLYEDAKTVLSYLNQQGVSKENIVLVGYSLGSGIAVEMAVQGVGSKLVLLAPYTSIPSVAQSFAPIFPMVQLIPEHFDTLSKVSKITIPALLIHGTRDRIVPYFMSAELQKKFKNASLLTLEGKGHTNIFTEEVFDAILRFVQSTDSSLN